MTDLGPGILPSPDNGAHARRGRRPLNKLPDRSSHGWSPTDRAPRLRRVATLLEQRASRTAEPDKVRRLARDMRIRAQLIEAGDVDELGDALALLALAAHDFAVL